MSEETEAACLELQRDEAARVQLGDDAIEPEVKTQGRQPFDDALRGPEGDLLGEDVLVRQAGHPLGERAAEVGGPGAGATDRGSGELGLTGAPDTPLLGIISRLTLQKGVDLIESAFGALLERDVEFVLLGSGEARFEQFFRGLPDRYPGRVAVRLGFDEPLAHRIEAGADFFLMPSRYEPCGLNQMFSLKYGTIPIVRPVGGLKDTVEDYDAERQTGTGLVIKSHEPEALIEAIDRGLEVYADCRAWTDLRRRGMAMDFSWDRSAKLYSDLYLSLPA